MLRTILILIFTLLLIPLVALKYDQALSIEQWEVLMLLLKIMLGVALSCFVISELTSNYSQVDKLWSIMPIVYSWVAAWHSGFDARLCLMAILATAWGLRLTYNFARRGGYSWPPWKGEEDYRWAELRKQPMFQKRFVFSLFNLFFIALYQHGLILLFTLPILVAWQGAATPLYWADGIVSLLFLLILVLETLADQQQYDFQQEKYRRLNSGEALGGIYAAGFCQQGLWAKVRHPNYAAEQAIWFCFYLFSVTATGRWINWSLTGFVLLMLLFIGSSDFSEKISASKYPGYKDYQKRVPRFWPKLF